MHGYLDHCFIWDIDLDIFTCTIPEETPPSGWTPQSQTLTLFRTFERLPPELRNMVWKLAIQGSHYIDVEVKQILASCGSPTYTCDIHKKTLPTRFNYSLQIKSRIVEFGIMRVNRESRGVFLEAKPDTIQYAECQKIPFNAKMDFVCLDSYALFLLRLHSYGPNISPFAQIEFFAPINNLKLNKFHPQHTINTVAKTFKVETAKEVARLEGRINRETPREHCWIRNKEWNDSYSRDLYFILFSPSFLFDPKAMKYLKRLDDVIASPPMAVEPRKINVEWGQVYYGGFKTEKKRNKTVRKKFWRHFEGEM